MQNASARRKVREVVGPARDAREQIIETANSAIVELAPTARNDGEIVRAIYEAVLLKESRVLVRRDLLDDLFAALRDMGCDRDMPNDSPKWKRLKRATRALKETIR